MIRRLLVLSVCLLLAVSVKAQDVLPLRVPITPENAEQLAPLTLLSRGAIQDIVWSPDGAHIALVTGMGVWLYDAADLSAEARLVGAGEASVTAVAFSHDGQLMAISYADGGIEAHDIANGMILWNSKSSITANILISSSPLNFNRDQSVLLRIGGEMLERWDIHTGTRISTIAIPYGDIAISQDGALLINLTAVSELVLIDTASGQTLTQRAVEGFEDNRYSPSIMHSIIMKFSPDGSRFAIVGRELDTLRFFDTITLEEVLVISRYASSYIRDIHFTRDGRQFLVSTETLIRIWDTASGEEVAAIPGGGRIALQPNGTELIAFRAIDNVSALQIWNTENFALGERISLLPYQPYWALRTRFNDNSDGLISVEWNRIVHRDLQGVVRSTLSFTPPTADYFNTESSASYPKFSQDAHFVLLPHIQAMGIEAAGGRIMLLDVERWNIRIIPDVYTWSLCSDISSTGRYGAFDTGGIVNPVISIWNLEELYSIQTDVVVGYGQGCALIFSPDESLLAVSYSNAYQPQFALLEPTTGEIIRSRIVDRSQFGTPILFSASSNMLITLLISQQGHTASIQLWDVPALTRNRTIETPNNENVWRVALTSDGSILAGGGENGTLWLWDFDTGELLFTAHAHPSRIADLFFSLDGTLLFTQDIDGATYLWGIPTE